jgi:hypothetical protein
MEVLETRELGVTGFTHGHVFWDRLLTCYMHYCVTYGANCVVVGGRN